MGSLLAANSNLVGSIRHYQQALIQNPEHADAYSSLRIIACYQKFHPSVPTTGRAAESASSTQSLQPTCSKPVTKPREAVFICTKVGLFLFEQATSDLVYKPGFREWYINKPL